MVLNFCHGIYASPYRNLNVLQQILIVLFASDTSADTSSWRCFAKLRVYCQQTLSQFRLFVHAAMLNGRAWNLTNLGEMQAWETWWDWRFTLVFIIFKFNLLDVGSVQSMAVSLGENRVLPQAFTKHPDTPGPRWFLCLFKPHGFVLQSSENPLSQVIPNSKYLRSIFWLAGGSKHVLFMFKIASWGRKSPIFGTSIRAWNGWLNHQIQALVWLSPIRKVVTARLLEGNEPQLKNEFLFGVGCHLSDTVVGD